MVWLWIIIFAVLIGGFAGWYFLGKSKGAAAAGAVAGGYVAVKFLIWLAVVGLSIMFILWLFKIVF